MNSGEQTWVSRGLQATPVLGEHDSFSFRGAKARRSVEVESPDCFVRWIVTQSYGSVIARETVLETGPAARDCCECLPGANVVVTPWLLATMTDLGGNFACSVSRKGFLKRWVTIAAAVPIGAGVTMTVDSLVAPNPSLCVRMTDVPAAQLRHSEGPQDVAFCDNTFVYGTSKLYGGDETSAPYPAIAVTAWGDIPLVFPSGYRRKCMPPPNSTNLYKPSGAGMMFGTYSLSGTVMAATSSLYGVYTEPYTLGAYDAVAVRMSDTTAGDGLPAAPQQYSFSIV